MTIDDVDLAIVRVLQKNGRSSNREVARVLGISEGTVRQRLKKLETSKAIRLGLVMDAAASGETASAYVRIKAQPRQAKSLVRKIAALPDCSFAGLTVGPFDIVAFISAKSREEMIAVIDGEIAAMAGVLLMDVREPVDVAKHRFDLIHIP